MKKTLLTASSKIGTSHWLNESSCTWNVSEYIDKTLAETRVHETVNYWVVACMGHCQTMDWKVDVH